MIYHVETGDCYRKVKANDWKEAIKIAWKKNPPKEPGRFTRVGCDNNRGYLGTVEALKIAGYKVKNKSTQTRLINSEGRGMKITQQNRLLRLLKPGKWVGLPRILDLRIACYTKRISELRNLGFDIECSSTYWKGQRCVEYRLMQRDEHA